MLGKAARRDTIFSRRFGFSVESVELESDPKV